MQTILTPEINEVISALPNRPAVSIILPIEPKFSPATALLHKLKTVVDNVAHELTATYSKEVGQSIMERLRSIIANTKVDVHKKGVAIFVSQEFQKVLFLDVLVKERIVINNTFEIRHLLMHNKQANKYLVILLSGRQFKLYQGSTHEFLKIISAIPQSILAYQRDLGDEPVGPTAAAKRKEVLMDKFLHQVDKEISRLIALNHLPVFVLGAKKILGHFKKITKNSEGIVAYISGNYDKSGFSQLQELLKPYLATWRNDQQTQLFTLLDHAASQCRLAIGIKEVWDAALSKKGQKLVVENDFVCPNQLKTTTSDIGNPKVLYLPDAVDDIIANVIANGGDVDFTEHDALNRYEHIALVTY